MAAVGVDLLCLGHANGLYVTNLKVIEVFLNRDHIMMDMWLGRGGIRYDQKGMSSCHVILE